MKKILNNLSIRNKLLIIMTVIVTTGLIIVLLCFYFVTSKIIKSNYLEYQNNNLIQTKSLIDERINDINDILYEMSIDENIQLNLQKLNASSETGYKYNMMLKNINDKILKCSTKTDGFIEIYISSLKDDVSSTSNFMAPKLELPKEELYNNKGSSVWFDELNLDNMVSVGKMIYSLTTQKPIGFIYAYIKNEYLFEHLKEIRNNSDTQYYIFNVDGIEIDKKVKNKYADFLPYDMYKTEKRINSIKINEGINLNYIKIYNINWYVINEIPNINNIKEVKELGVTIIVIFLIIIIGVMIVIVIVSNSISKPIIELSKAMSEFAKGNTDIKVTPKNRDEVGKLGESFNKMTDDFNNMVLSVYKERNLKQQAIISSLRMQISPHFLYNTLDIINWMAMAHNADDISEIVRSLGMLMRFSLQTTNFLKVKEELDAVESYICIQRYRHGDELSLYMQVDDDILNAKIPRNILLPLIENSIKHGFKNKRDDKIINLSIYKLHNELCVEIEDNGNGISKVKCKEIIDNLRKEDNLDERKEESEHFSIGLKNVNDRLKMFYGQKYGLFIESVQYEYTKIQFFIPLDFNDNYKDPGKMEDMI